VVEDSVLARKFVEVENHLFGGPFDVFLVARGQVGLRLERRDHEHVVDPQARLV